MLNCALRIQKAFESLLSDVNFVKYFEEVDKYGKKKEGPPIETDWENATVFVKFLETFYEVTLRFSGSTYVTADKYFIEICNMQRTLYRMAVEEDDPLLVSMAQRMTVKYEKYWGKIEECNEALIIVLVHDLRYKLKYLNHCFKAFYGPLTCAQMVNEVEQKLRSLFDLYGGGGSTLLQSSMTQSQSLSHYQPRPQPSGSSSSSFTTTSRLKKYALLHDEFVQQRKEEDGDKTKNEVDRYLTEDVEPMIKGVNFDILKGWVRNASKYKNLSTIARDMLATVVSEAAISTGVMEMYNVAEITDDITIAASGSENISTSPSGSINAPSTASSAAQGTESMKMGTSSLDFGYFVDF
ncbi:zinc finger BED domain-containing protein RICESLEEPER 1-like [Humulus lupulus]|uniref:zinc finger BED domain-containing protein RICESLEEPER 1-like n=1 Tax=Humulus lupulus TaxID=3486 RepID=UPI002B4010BC|nr:zinc finger BED domain-containing protein RICESLEEPER 1-like [Humulus lupulus]